MTASAQRNPSSTSIAGPFFLTRAKNLARQAAERQNGGLAVYRAESTMYGPAIDAPHVQNADGSVTFSFRGGPPGFTTPTIETIATVTTAGKVQLQYNGPLRSATLAKVKSRPTKPQAPIQLAPQGLTPLEQPVPIPITPNTPTHSTAPQPPQPSLGPSQTTTLPQGSVLPTLRPSLSDNPNARSLPDSSSSGLVKPTVRPNVLPRTLPTPPQNNGIYADLFLSRAKNLARQAAISANGGLALYRPEPAMFGPAANTPHIKNADGSVTFKFKGGAPGYTMPTLESVVTVAPGSIVTVTYNGPLRP